MLLFMAMIEEDNDREKFRQVYEQYHRLMLCVAFNILHDHQESEDAVQEAFIKIAENISKISDPGCTKTKSFVVIITERKAIDILRKRNRRSEIPFEETDMPVRADFEEDILAESIASLPPLYREVIILKYVHGYKLREIARLLGITTGYAQRIDQRAKKKLKNILKENENNEI